jgi:hypothetical protein
MKLFRFDAFHVHAPDCQASRTVTMFATLIAATDWPDKPVNNDDLNPDSRSGATFIAANWLSVVPSFTRGCAIATDEALIAMTTIAP